MIALGPTLTTDRLTLRPPRLDDFEPFAGFYRSDAAYFVGGPLGEKDTWRWFTSFVGHWALHGYGWFHVSRADGTPVGFAGPHHPPAHAEREIGWFIYEGAQRKGYATEAARAARDWTHATLPPATLVSYIDVANAASQGVARALGAATDGTRAAHDAGCEIWRHPAPAGTAAEVGQRARRLPDAEPTQIRRPGPGTGGGDV